jgi:membrane fusion protein (multidrug efflux system)
MQSGKKALRLFSRGGGLLLLSILAGFALASCSGTSGQSPAPAKTAGAGGSEAKKDPINVRAEPIQRGPLSSLYTTSATLRADKQATVTARTRGVIERLLVEEGDTVAAGEPMAELEDEEQKIQYEKSSATRDLRKREYERAKELFARGLVSVEDYETARSQAEEAEHVAALDELTLKRTVIRAPFGGRVLRRNLDPGATVSDGTPVYELADLDPLYADVNVPERHTALLAVGQTVRFTADATGEVVDARIERIAPSVDPSTGTVKVTLAVAGRTSLRPGSFVRVVVVTDTHENALVVPRTALVAEGRRWHLYRLKADGKHVQELEVELGFEEGDRVELVGLTSSGENSGSRLEPGQQVVVSGAGALSDNALVRVVESQAKPGDQAGDEKTDQAKAAEGK